MRIYKIVGIVLSAILLLASCTNSDLEKKKVKKKPKKKSGEKSHKEPEKDLVQKRQKPEEQTAPAI